MRQATSTARSGRTLRIAQRPTLTRAFTEKAKANLRNFCYMGHILRENRNGLAIATHLTQANGMAEREAALAMAPPAWMRVPRWGLTKRIMLGFKQALKDRHLVPHMALRSDTGWGGKRIEQIFGWVKTVAGLAKTKFRGLRRVAQGFDLAVAAYNLIRFPKLLNGSMLP
jgi:hypothetical protein